jgi:ATP-binding cassette subfamily B protein
VKDLKYLNKYFYKYKHYLLSGILFVTISNIFQIIPAQLVRHALDMISENLSVYNSFSGLSAQTVLDEMINKTIVLYGMLILLIAILRGLFLFLVRQTIIVMSRHIEYDLKNEIYAHYQQLPLNFYRQNNTGDLIARISEDVSKVRMYIGPAIMYGISMLTLFVILIPIMFSINAKLALFALIPLPFLSVSIYFVNNIINKRSEEIQKSLSDLSTFVQEAFSGIRVLKSFAREHESIKNFRAESNQYKKKSLRLTRVNALFFPFIMSLIGLSTIFTIYAGGIEVIRGSVSIGNIVEFILYVSLLTWPVTSLGWITSVIQRAAASQKRINEFLQIKNDLLSTRNRETPIDGEISFKNVSFTYAHTGITAIKNVSFGVSPGQSLAIIGTTGSGKSTIANLICRLFDVSSGTIQIDGFDLREYEVTHLRSSIGYVPQDVFLFSDTILNNVAFGVQNANQNHIIDALKTADLYEDILRIPEQFETLIGERGITLSGGQKQRLSIARALIRNPKILILDDCLSAVDTKTENNILNNLKEIRKNNTNIIISHRVSSARLADYIIVLHDGQIVEEGTYENLLQTGGTFKALYERQLVEESSATDSPYGITF